MEEQEEGLEESGRSPPCARMTHIFYLFVVYFNIFCILCASAVSLFLYLCVLHVQCIYRCECTL